MARTYGYSLDREAVATLVLCSGRERRLLLNAFEKMACYPQTPGDFSQTGSDGREHHIFDIGDFVVTTWSDHAVQTVRILLIERV